MAGRRKRGLVKRAEVFESSGEEFFFVGREIPVGLAGNHFQRVDDGLRRTEISLFLAIMRIRDLAEEKPGVLGLEDDEFVEPRIGIGHCWHGANLLIAAKLYKREANDGEINDDLRGSSFALQG
jgi:hypothetical protein